MIKEDAPTVNVGSGNIPGAGVAAAGKPARSEEHTSELQSH